MADNISNIVDPSAFSQLQQLIDLLVKTESAISAAADEAKNIKINIQGSENLATISAQIDKMASAIDALNQVSADNIALVNQQRLSTASYGSAATDLAGKTAELKYQLIIENEILRGLNEEYKNGIISQQQYSLAAGQTVQRINELKIGLKESNDALNYQIKNVSLAEDSISGLNNKLKDLTNQYKLLTAEQRKSADGIALSASIKETSSAMTIASRAIQDTTNKLGLLDRIGLQAQRTFIRFIAMQPELLAFMIISKVFDSIAESITKVSDAEQDAIDRTKQLADELKKYKKDKINATSDSATESDLEIIKLEVAFKTIQSTTASIKAKKSAYDELNASIGESISKYSEEDVISGKANATIKEKIQAYSDLAGKIKTVTNFYEQETKLYEDAQAKYDQQRQLTPNAPEDLTARGVLDKRRDQMFRRREELENLLQQQNEQNAGGRNTTTGLPPLSTNDTGSKKQIDALRKLVKDQLEIERDANKAIVDDTNYSLQERLNANMAYFNTLNKLVQNDTEKQIEEQSIVIKNAQARGASLEGQLSGLEKGYGGKNKQFYKDENVQKLQIGIESQKDIIKAAQIALIDAQSQASVKMQKNERDTQNAIFTIFNSNGERILATQDKIDTERQTRDALSAAMEIKALNDKLQAKEITSEQYHERAEKINKEFRKKQLEDEVQAYQTMLDATGDKRIVGGNRTLVIGKQGAAQKELNDINAGKSSSNPNSDMSPLGKLFMNGFGDSTKTGDDLKKQQQAAEQAASQTIELAQKTADAVKTIKDNEFAHEQDLLNKQAQQVQFEAEQRINAINASVGYNISKQNQLATVNAQTAAQESMLKQKQQDLDVKKARFDRSAAEANVIMSTAQAEAAALTLLGNEFTAPFYPAVAALIATTGAAEFAAASSAPIPTYRYGITATHTPMFIAGEAGENELITPPNKPAYWSGTSAKLFHEPLGTSVTPISKLRKFAEDNLTNSIGIENDKITYILNEKPNDNSYSVLADVFNDKIDTLVTAIERNRPLPLPDLNDAIRMTIKQEQLRGRN